MGGVCREDEVWLGLECGRDLPREEDHIWADEKGEDVVRA